MDFTAQQLIDKLGLMPHLEGGWYRFMWRSELNIPQSLLPEGYTGDRAGCGLIYYFLKDDEVSRWHQLRSPEIWTWHCGSPLVMTLGGTGKTPVSETEVLIGSNLDAGEQFQIIVPPNQWQTTRLKDGGFALVSCVVSPAFHQDDCYMPELPD